MADYYNDIYDDPSSQLMAELEGAATTRTPLSNNQNAITRSATAEDFVKNKASLPKPINGRDRSSRDFLNNNHYVDENHVNQNRIHRVSENYNNHNPKYIDRDDRMFPQIPPNLREGEAMLKIKTEFQDVVQDGERFGDRDIYVEELENEDEDAEQEIVQDGEYDSDAEDSASQTEDEDVEMRNADEDVGIGHIAQVGYVSRMGDIRWVRRGVSHVSATPELGEDTVKAEEVDDATSDYEDLASEQDEIDEDERMEDREEDHEDGDHEDESISVKVDESDNSEAQSESDSEARNEDRELSHSTDEDHDNDNGFTKGTGQDSAAPGSTPEPRLPVEEIKKQYKGDKNLHDKAKAHCALRVDSLPGRGRFLVAVLDHRVELKDVRKERDFLWIKANKNNTVETIWHTYQNATAEAEFDLWTHNEIPDRKEQLKELNFYADKVVVFRARKKEDLATKGFKNAPIILD